MSTAPTDVGWSEEERAGGHDVAIRHSRTVSALLLVVALGLEAWGLANVRAILTVTDAIDQAYYPRPTYRLWQTGPLASVPWVVATVCFVVIWRAIGRLRDTPTMRVDRSGFTLTGSAMLPRRVGFDIPLAEIQKFDPLPAGFSTDVIPLGGGWDVVVVARRGATRRLGLPLDDLEQAEWVAKRLNHLVANARPHAIR